MVSGATQACGRAEEAKLQPTQSETGQRLGIKQQQTAFSASRVTPTMMMRFVLTNAADVRRGGVLLPRRENTIWGVQPTLIDGPRCEGEEHLSATGLLWQAAPANKVAAAKGAEVGAPMNAERAVRMCPGAGSGASI